MTANIDDANWAVNRVVNMCACAYVDATVYGRKLLKGFGWPNETFHAAQDARALSTVLLMVRWQPIEFAPKDRMIIGALIRDGRVWRVHEMRHNGLAFYTSSGGSLPQMTHWTLMPELIEDAG